MPTSVFINIPVTDLDRAKSFYTALGYSVNEQFTDEKASNIVISDTIYVMLLTREYFATFASKDVADTATSAAAIMALSADSREAVDELADKAIAAGGRQTNEPQDMGFMYSRSFQDPDGNLWETLWMDPTFVQ